MWRKPALDPTYGETALATYNTLLGLYPTSPLIPEAKKELAELEDMFAQKNYLAGMYYLRRKAYDSGIIYFKDVLAKYPTTPTARLAQLRLVDSYKAIRYKEDAADACAVLRKNYPDDAEVRTTCEARRRRLWLRRPERRTASRRPPARPTRRRRRPRLEACASGSSGGASTRRTSGTCSRSSTPPRRSSSTPSIS